MISVALAGFDAMSASATIRRASSPVASGMGSLALAYFVWIQIGTRVPAAVLPVFCTGTLGSLRFRYGAPTVDPLLIAALGPGVPTNPLSVQTRFLSRSATPDAVTS